MKNLFAIVLLFATSSICLAGTKTWDGEHDTELIELTIVYFVPSDRKPLPDWRDRAEYFAQRAELFHTREFQGQSELQATVHPDPLISKATTAELRRGDQNATFFKTLQETDERLEFGRGERTGFPILLVLSEINWRPLDDFYRLRPEESGLGFEGVNSNGVHFPGARSGGSRATYLAERGVGWGLVSADGWRVPYRGTDCVIYHEGCGHTVGLPHPEKPNGSVMSLAQYQGWLSESWLDKDQKTRLGWEPAEVDQESQIQLFTKFRALPTPPIPRPGQPAKLKLDWPEGAKVSSLRVRFQTAVDGPWIDVPQTWDGNAPSDAALVALDRETPVSYRLDAELEDGATVELWGYYQVRNDPRRNPIPRSLSPDLIRPTEGALRPVARPSGKEIDLLAITQPDACWKTGDWSRDDGQLVSPKQPGARIELPYTPPEEYRLTLIIEPLDEPHGLILGQRSAENRFVTLINFDRDDQIRSALENIDGRNVGNESTFVGSLFRKNRLSQAVVTVKKSGVSVLVDGRLVIDWKGKPDRLSLSDYWRTPNDKALFVGAYDCRYRFHRLTLETISGQGNVLDNGEDN